MRSRAKAKRAHEDLLTLLKERDLSTLITLSKMLTVKQVQEIPANKLVAVAMHSTKEAERFAREEDKRLRDEYYQSL